MGAKKIVKLLYRSTRYGTWQPASITITDEIEEDAIKQYCKDDIIKQGLKVAEIEIKKVIKC